MTQASPDTTLRVAIATAVFSSMTAALYTLAEVEPSPPVQTFMTIGPPIAVILWLQKDAQRTRIGRVLDFGLFAWIAWPVVVPWYAFKSRGRAGWGLLCGLIVLIYSAHLAAFVVTLLKYGVRLAIWYFETHD